MNRKPTLYEYLPKATTDIYSVISNETNTEWIKGIPDYILSYLFRIQTM